jgi:hypothetical protein
MVSIPDEPVLDPHGVRRTLYNLRMARLAADRAAGELTDVEYELEAARAMVERFEPPAVAVNPPVAEPSVIGTERPALVALGFLAGLVIGVFVSLL